MDVGTGLEGRFWPPMAHESGAPGSGWLDLAPVLGNWRHAIEKGKKR